MTTLPPTDDDLTTLFRLHYTPLVRLAAVLVDDIGQCEEIVQDAFAKLMTVDPGPAPGKEAPYLRSAVLNGARSRLRRVQVRRRHPDPVAATAPSAEQLAIARAEARAVLEVLRTLPTRQAEVLALRFQADLSEQEIANTLGISPGSVKTHASRGLATLRDRLGDPPSPPPENSPTPERP